MEKISFEIGGVILLEPLSTMMNWVLAAQCYYYYTRLTQEGPSNSLIRNWKLFFLLHAVSLLFGGFSHLLYHYTDLNGKIPGWTSAIIGTAFGEIALVASLNPSGRKNILYSVIMAKLFATAVLLIYNFSFKWVMINTAGLFLFILIISIYNLRKGQSGYKYFLIGIGSMLLMGLVKAAGLDLHHAWFTRNDLAHLFMLLTYWMFYRAVIKVKSDASLVTN